MNVRAFSSHVKQKENSPKVVSKETVLNESLVQTKKRSPWEVTSHGSATVIVWQKKFPSSHLINAFVEHKFNSPLQYQQSFEQSKWSNVQFYQLLLSFLSFRLLDHMCLTKQ